MHGLRNTRPLLSSKSDASVTIFRNSHMPATRTPPARVTVSLAQQPEEEARLLERVSTGASSTSRSRSRRCKERFWWPTQSSAPQLPMPCRYGFPETGSITTTRRHGCTGAPSDAPTEMCTPLPTPAESRRVHDHGLPPRRFPLPAPPAHLPLLGALGA